MTYEPSTAMELEAYTNAVNPTSLYSPETAFADQAASINGKLRSLGPNATLVLPPGTYGIGSAIVLLPGQSIIGRGATIVPLAAMSSMVEMSESSAITSVVLQNSDELADIAIHFKSGSNLTSRMASCTIISFSTAVQVDCGAFDIVDNFFLNNGVAITIASSQSTGSGKISSNYVLGGSGFDIASGTEPGSTTEILSNILLPAVLNAYGIRARSGASVSIERNVVDQIISGPGIVINGATGLFGAVSIVGNYIGSNADASAATDGVRISGLLANVSVAYNTFAGWGNYDLAVDGGSDLYVAGNNFSSTRGAGNLSLSSVENVTLIGNQLESRTASIVESGSTTSTLVGNTLYAMPQGIHASANAADWGLDPSTPVAATTARTDGIGEWVRPWTIQGYLDHPSLSITGAILDISTLVSMDVSVKADNSGVINAALAHIPPGDTLVLPAGTYGIKAPIQLNGRNLAGLGTTLVPLVSMVSAVVVTGGFSSVSGLHLSDVHHVAGSGISATKAADNLPLSIHDNTIEGFSHAIELEGDNFSVQKNLLFDNGVGITLGSFTLNGRLSGNYISGGSGIDLEGGAQQPEGIDISSNIISPGTVDSYGVLVRSGLEIEISENTINHVGRGRGIVLDASASAVAYVAITGNVVSGPSTDSAKDNDGILIVDNVINTTIAENRIVNWSGYDINATGGNKIFIGNNSFDSASPLGNILLVNMANASVIGNSLGSMPSNIISFGSYIPFESGNSSGHLTVGMNSAKVALGLSERNGLQTSIIILTLPSNGVVSRNGGETISVGDKLTADDLNGLQFTPTIGLSGQSSCLTYFVSDSTGITSVGREVIGITSDALPTISPTLNGAFAVTNLVNGCSGGSDGATYEGFLAYLQHEFVWEGTEGIAVRANVANVFLHGGSGDDALEATGGSNVLDGGAGSNFLIGASGADGGTDTFFTDARGEAIVWSTLVNFHIGDDATLWGFDPRVSSWHWEESSGVGGYTGATLRAYVHGKGEVDASITFAGLTMSQALELDVTSGSSAGASYLLLHSRNS